MMNKYAKMVLFGFILWLVPLSPVSFLLIEAVITGIEIQLYNPLQ